MAGQASETMRIHMGQARSVVVKGASLSAAPGDETAAFEPIAGRQVSVQSRNGQLWVNGRKYASASVRFHSEPAEEHRGIQVAGREVRGDLVVRAARGTLELINVISLEEYLVGVLGGEMPKSFPPEALRAQAVAARTYALQRKLQSLDSEFHLGSDVLSQVYRGLSAEDERTRNAVEATRGMVLTFELSPIEAYFHASCGGKTASGLEALTRDLPYLQPVDCPCGRLENVKWRTKIRSSELPDVFRQGVRSMSVQSRTGTGRVQRLDAGSGRTLEGSVFRERLGYSRVKSLQFELRRAHDAYELQGRGFGHGAGLCQWGAKLLAEEGWHFDEILSHYYPGTALQALY